MCHTPTNYKGASPSELVGVAHETILHAVYRGEKHSVLKTYKYT